MNARVTKTLVITAVVAVLGITAAHAQPETSLRGNVISDGPQFEIFASSFASDLETGSNDTQLGLRGAYHFNNRFALEGSLSKSSDYDFWLADLSAKFYLKNRGRVAAYAVAGPGMIFGSDVLTDETTVHLGLGLEIAAGQHLYVRPEVREVALTKDLSINDELFSLGIGWRM